MRMAGTRFREHNTAHSVCPLRANSPLMTLTPLVDREGHIFEMSHSGHPCATHQPTRTNLEIIENNGMVTEILELACGPSAAKLSAVQAACKKRFSTKSEAMSVIFSGSLPAGAPVDRYAGLIQLAHEFRCRPYLDT